MLVFIALNVPISQDLLFEVFDAAKQKFLNDIRAF
jgi:hypothetical protein